MAGSTAVPTRREPTPDEFVAMQQSPEFQELRSTFRGFTFPVMIAALIWYLLLRHLCHLRTGGYGTAFPWPEPGPVDGVGAVHYHLRHHLRLCEVGEQEYRAACGTDP